MRVEDLMTTDVRTCRPHDTLNIAAQILWDSDCGSLPVLDEERRVIGMLTDRDIAMAVYTQGKPLAEVPVASAMSKSALGVGAKDGLAAAHEIMRTNAVRRVPVIEDDGRLAGFLSLNDLARAAAENQDRKARDAGMVEVARTLAAVGQPRGSTPPPMDHP